VEEWKDLITFCMAGYCNDLYQYSPTEQVWKNLTNMVDGPAPSPRAEHAITSSDDGRIYVFGGFTAAGEALQRYVTNSHTKDWGID
jgi:N-acetylneuraminic acid mutarotase